MEYFSKKFGQITEKIVMALHILILLINKIYTIKNEVVYLRYIWSFIWALCISGVISYVLSNMAGESFNLVNTLILSVILMLGVVFLGDSALKEEEQS